MKSFLAEVNIFEEEQKNGGNTMVNVFIIHSGKDYDYVKSTVEK